MSKQVQGYNFYGEKVMMPIDGLEVRPSAYGLVVNSGKIALIRLVTGKYFFPGGGLESGESMEEAMRREVLEETGLEVTSAQLIDANELFFEYTPTNDRFHSLQFFIYAKLLFLTLLKCQYTLTRALIHCYG